MYLSRIVLNLRSRLVQRDLADCQSFHRRLMSAFGPAPHGANAREYFGVLFRLEIGRSEGTSLLVQSRIKPDWLKLPGDYLDPAEADNPAVKDVSRIYSGISTGQVLSFRLRANVTRRVNKHSKFGDPDHKSEWKGKRVEIWGENRQLEWLFRKGQAAGFDVVTAHLDGDKEYLEAGANPGGKLEGKKNEKRLSFGAVTFEGLLRVVEVEKFRETISKGIGPAKAYGFGLLSIAAPL